MIVVAAIGSTTMAVVCAELVANVRLNTGELRIANWGPDAFQLTGYQINSNAIDLNVDGWLPISGRLDAVGDGSFDPDNEWTVIAPPMPLPMSADEIFEGTFTGNGGRSRQERPCISGKFTALASRSG